MKILLLGEFSGVYANLKQGLKELGHEVVLAANGDGWKNVPGADIPLFRYKASSNKLNKIKNVLINPIFDNRFTGYDVVQAIYPCIYHYYLTDIPFKRISKENGSLFVNGAGLDWFLYDAWKRGKYKKTNYFLQNNPVTQSIVDGKNLISKLNNYTCKSVMSMADGIIPCIPYEYEIPYINLHNRLPAIMFPINTNTYKYTPNIVKDKITFFHGVNRAEDKGTPYIIKAMKRLQERYPHDVECIVAERMEYKQYIQAIERTNVIVDQCRTYGYGMNCCISLAKGKIVMSCAEDEFLENARINRKDCAVVNIRPDVEYILTQMELIVSEKKRIEEMGYNSYKYIIEHHNYIDIAERYIDTWYSKGKVKV